MTELTTATLAMLLLSGSVAAGYFTIALVVAPRIRMPSASSRLLRLVRGAAILFFLGCGMTHLHILVHTLGVGGRVRAVEGHDLVFHVAQAIGAWLFILGAALKLELHVVPSERTTTQRDVARAKLAEQQALTNSFARRAARASALARISEQALTHDDPAGFVRDAATITRKALPEGCVVTVDEQQLAQPLSADHTPLLRLRESPGCDEADREFISSVCNLLTNSVRRFQVEEELRHRSLHDPLTGLPNRVLLLDRLEQALARGRRAGGRVSVLFVDLDGFKQVNDALGHEAGDRLLAEAAARLASVARPEDTIARQSGDEFIVVCEGSDNLTAERIARRVVERVGRPYPLDKGVARVSASVGVATSGPASSSDELLRSADAAMYLAKERGGNRVERFDEALQARLARLEGMERDLQGALDRDELFLVYQPILQLDADRQRERVIGAEALLRWNRRSEGLVSPAEFIPIAEARGLIGEIGDWVVRQACAQAASWRARLPATAELLLAVNVSRCQATERDFASRLMATVLAAGARPEDLVIELTETAMTDDDHDPTHLAEALRELRTFGLRVALDDFGTGYSSLTHLRTLPIDILKVDSSFVAGLGTGGKEQSIVTALAGLTQELGVQVVAEGIETPEQHLAVRNLRFDMAQGFLLGRPMPPEAFAELLPLDDAIEGAASS